jgi:hypothetical protein
MPLDSEARGGTRLDTCAQQLTDVTVRPRLEQLDDLRVVRGPRRGRENQSSIGVGPTHVDTRD